MKSLHVLGNARSQGNQYLTLTFAFFGASSAVSAPAALVN
jgi:hypothetical protein